MNKNSRITRKSAGILHNSAGQTLIALLIFMILAIGITTASAVITIINTRANDSYVHGATALQYAEAGIENALLRLERDPSYSGETLTLPTGNATVTVTGSGTKTIVSVGVSGAAKRTVTATASYSGDTITLTSWSETP